MSDGQRTPRSVGALLASPQMRAGSPNLAYISEEHLPGVGRWKRIRQWERRGDPSALILPWIVLNPAGNSIELAEDAPQPLRKKGAGWTMTVLSWRWGFDGFCAYNVFPFEAKRPKDLPPLIEAHGTQGIAESHVRIATELAHEGGVIVAWGGRQRKLTATWSNKLLAAIDSLDGTMRNTWCIGLNQNGTPVIPAA